MAGVKKFKGNIYSYFTRDEDTGKAICNIEKCAIKITVSLKSSRIIFSKFCFLICQNILHLLQWHSSTLKRHMLGKHKINVDETDVNENQPKISNLFGSSDENYVLRRCVNLAISGRPFKMFDDRDFQDIANTNKHGAADIHSKKVRQGVVDRAQSLRETMKKKLRGRQLSISTDFGNRNGIDFLGELKEISLSFLVL